MRRLAPALCLFAFVAAASASAGEAQMDAARSTIENQLRAFRSGDDALAYSYAAPGVKQIFPDVGSFMRMVTGAYQPVYRPRSYEFGAAQEIGPGQIAQRLIVVGPDGKDYEALYTLQLQPDGVYRITGVSIRAAAALSI